MGGLISVIIMIILVAKAVKTNEAKRAQYGSPEVTVKTEDITGHLEPPKSSKVKANQYDNPRRESRRAGKKQNVRTSKPAETIHEYVNDNIVKKSMQNVQEKFEEDVLVRDSEKHEHCIEGHYEENEDLIKRVEDLMVLGPNCTISYERDFVGEGEAFVSFF